MKLIHLPTGKERDYEPNIAEAGLNTFPNEFIRAELPQYWRVEGYEKSWGYLCVKENKVLINCLELNWVGYDGIKVEGYSNGHPVTRDMEIISRAEFEYHIYNPWKKVQDEMAQLEKGISNSRLNEQLDMSDIIDKIREKAGKMGYEFTYLLTKDLIGNPATPYIKTNSTNTADYDLSKPIINEQAVLSESNPNRYDLDTLKQQGNEMKFKRETQSPLLVDPADGLLKDPTRPRIDYSQFDKPVLTAEMLVQQIKLNQDSYIYTNGNTIKGFDNPMEIEGFVLVHSPINADTIKQQAEKMGYELVRKVVEESWCGHEDLNNYSLKEYGQIWLQINCPDTREEIRMPEQDIQTLIEKYNQFKTNNH
jgi:hypothetical protein